MGTSLREADYHLRFLISFINERAKIIVIDKDGNAIKNKFARYIPVNRNNIESIEKPIEDITEKDAFKIYNE